MKRIKRAVALVVSALLAAAVLWVAFNFRDLKAFVPMPSGAYAKFMCSCLFVQGMTEDEARDWSRMPVPVYRVKIDYGKKTVSASSLFVRSTARHAGEECGCVLE